MNKTCRLLSFWLLYHCFMCGEHTKEEYSFRQLLLQAGGMSFFPETVARNRFERSYDFCALMFAAQTQSVDKLTSLP